MDGQSITLKIAGKDYSLKASSPEMEQTMRLAADDVNKMFANYTQMYPDRTPEDKLAFVALLETVNMLRIQRKAHQLGEEVKALQTEADSYLAGVE